MFFTPVTAVLSLMPPVAFSSTPNPNALRCDAPGVRWPAPPAAAPVLTPIPTPVPNSIPAPNPVPAQVPAQSPALPRTFRSYRSAPEALAAGDHFAHNLLLIPGLCGVLIHENWLTVSKAPQAKWPPIKRAVTTLIVASARAEYQ